MKKVLIFFFFVWFLLEGIGFSFNLDGVWYGIWEGDDLELEVIDILHLENDKLYIAGTGECNNTEDGSIVLHQVGENTFRAESFYCSVEGFRGFYRYMEISFHNDHSAHVKAEILFENKTYEFQINIEKLRATPLSPGEEITVSGAEDSLKVFFIDIPDGTTKLEVKTWGGWGDCDLYVGHVHPMVLSDSEEDYTDEKIIISHPVSGRWYIIIYGFEDYDNVKLKATLTKGNNSQVSQSPQADIKINFSDEHQFLSHFQPLRIQLSFNPGSYTGYQADWWLLLQGPEGFYYFDLDSWTFLPGIQVTYQGELFSFPLIEFFNKTFINWPKGQYTIYFGVDLRMNGTIDLDQAFYDVVDFSLIP